MPVTIETVTADRLDVVQRYYEQVWGRRDDAFYRWRFLSSPAVTTWLAIPEAGDAGAMISAMRKPYQFDGRVVDSFEIFDWSSLPLYRGKGLGIALVQHVMKEGLPVFTLGGSEDTLRLLPRLKWASVAKGRVFALPLRSGWVRKRAGGAKGVAAGLAFAAAGRLWFGPSNRGASDVVVEAVPQVSVADIHEIYGGDAHHALVAGVDPGVIDWAEHGWERPGSYHRFVARRNGQLCGFGLARMVMTPDEQRGEISEVFARGDDVAVYERLISAMTRALDRLGAGVVVSTASCPQVQAALRRSHFLAGHDHELLGFRAEGFPSSGKPVHVMRATADHLLLPLPAPGR